MKTKITRTGRTLKVTLCVNRNNIYHKELEQLLEKVSLDPYSKLRFINDVEQYLEAAEHYIEVSKTFNKNEFYKDPGKCLTDMKKTAAIDIKKHLKRIL